MTSQSSSDASAPSEALGVSPSTPLSWDHAIVDIPKAGLAVERPATPEECAAIRATLGGQPPGLVQLSDLVARYRIDRLAGGGYRLKGRIGADAVQACIVTLDPITTRVEDQFDVEFWADIAPSDDASNEIGVFEVREVEPIEQGMISAGRIVFETLAAALPPYPRKPDAHFEWTDQALETPEKTSPFAVLSRLRDKQ